MHELNAIEGLAAVAQQYGAAMLKCIAEHHLQLSVGGTPALGDFQRAPTPPKLAVWKDFQIQRMSIEAVAASKNIQER